MGLLARVGRIIEQLGQVQWKYSDPTRVDLLYADKYRRRVPEEIDPAVADDLVRDAMGFLPLTLGNKVLCTKRQLRD